MELALDSLFELPENQFIAFDAEALLRADFLARVDALTKGISGGLFSPNEARFKEGLEAKEGGDEPRVQAQVVPLSFAYKTPAPAAPTAPVSPSAPTSSGGNGDGEDGEDPPEDPPTPPPEDKTVSVEDYATYLRGIADAA